MLLLGQALAGFALTSSSSLATFPVRRPVDVASLVANFDWEDLALAEASHPVVEGLMEVPVDTLAQNRTVAVALAIVIDFCRPSLEVPAVAGVVGYCC